MGRLLRCTNLSRDEGESVYVELAHVADGDSGLGVKKGRDNRAAVKERKASAAMNTAQTISRTMEAKGKETS